MKKNLLISFIAFNLLLSQSYAFTPEELEQLRQKAEFAAEEAEQFTDEARWEAERAEEEARWEAAQVRQKAELDAEFAAEEARRFAEEVRWGEERAAEEARRDAARAAEVAREESEDTCWEVERVAQRAAEQVKTQKVDALMATGMFWLDALQYVSENPDLDVDAFLKKRNEEIAARERIEALWQTLSGYGFDYQLIDVILQDSDFNLSDLSDLGREKLEVINYLMRRDYSYKQAIDFVKAPNFDVDAFFRAEEEKREAERAAWEAEQMRQAIETMRSKGLSVEEVNAILADEDFDAYQFNNQERDSFEDELREKENARQEMLRGKIEEIYLQMKLKFSDENRARYISTEQIVIQFGSEEDRLHWFDFKKAQMPDDFNWQTYLSSYPDLLVAVDKIGSDEAKEKWAITHYFLYGQYENRTKYKK